MRFTLIFLISFFLSAQVTAQFCSLSKEAIKENAKDKFLDILEPSGQIDFSKIPVTIKAGNQCSGYYRIGNIRCQNCLANGEARQDIIFNTLRDYQSNLLAIYRKSKCAEVKKAKSKCSIGKAINTAAVNRREDQIKEEAIKNIPQPLVGRQSFRNISKRREVEPEAENKAMDQAYHKVETEYNECMAAINSNSLKQCSVLESKARHLVLNLSDDLKINCTILSKSFYTMSLKTVTSKWLGLSTHDISYIKANRCPGTPRNPDETTEERIPEDSAE